MSVMLFLVISLIVHLIPIPYRQGMFRVSQLIRWIPFRLVWGIVAWAVICLMMMASLPWAILGLVMSFGILLIVSSGFRPGELPDMMEGLKIPMTCFGFLIILLLPMFTGLITWTADVNNAFSFNDKWITEDDSELFSNPIPDNQVRLVTAEYATFLANQKIAPLGSEVSVAAAHITTYEGRLVWACVVVSTNTLAQNYMQGLVIVDANDPSNIALYNSTELPFPVAEGLFWDKNIQFGNYLNDISNIYEYAYPTWDDKGNLVYVQTRTNLGFDFVENPLGPIVYYSNGTRIPYDTVADAPNWITQKYSEEWLERQVTRWGSYRRGDSFDLFAGGFLWIVAPSNDRLVMTEDTRYILNPDTNRVEAFIAVHPPGTTTLALSGVFRATSEGVFYHDLSGFAYQSGDSANNAVFNSEPLLQSGDYYGAMPLIYPVEISPGVRRYAWYCPIYSYVWGSSDDDYYVEDIKLYGLALVDALNTNKLYLQKAGGTLVGEDLVREAREGYIEIMGGSIEEPPETAIELTATVLNKTAYVHDGETYVLLKTDNSSYEYILGTLDWMNSTDWFDLLLTINVGDSFTATLSPVGDEYRIVAITKN